MLNTIKAEHLKLKHTLGAFLPVIAPFYGYASGTAPDRRL